MGLHVASVKRRCEGFHFCAQKVAICSYVRARSSMPHLVALVPAEEVVDDAGLQARSAGQPCWAQVTAVSADTSRAVHVHVHPHDLNLLPRPKT